ncbi:hypothetical protein OS128_05220 [Corynebacterium sp. P5848]|uniref:hypothetical protein n=1 Tax=Corynebacterium marambiense TaxID=2765364 RepID=UPI002260844B|nr:hypothetical protein [Corynebacterium marambiense]MCX7542311.1 hypothetical protein [Corynebacterium marambiense]
MARDAHRLEVVEIVCPALRHWADVVDREGAAGALGRLDLTAPVVPSHHGPR